MIDARIREKGVDRSAAWFVLNVAIAMAAFYVPAFLLPASIGLMNGLIVGSLVLFALWLILPAVARVITLAGRLAGLVACMAAGFGLAGILLVYLVAAPIASPLAATVAALWLGALFTVAIVWRLTAGTVRTLLGFGIAARLATALALVAPLTGYGWAVAVAIDQARDRGTPQLFVAELYAQQIRHSRYGRAFNELHLAPWGKQAARSVTVDLPTYDAVSAGSNVCPLLHHGLLGIGWYRITPCPAALLAVTHHVPRDLPAEKRRGDMLLLPVMLLFGVIGLGWAAGGLATGQIDGRVNTYRRAEQPIMFWLNVVLWLVVGGAMLFGAIDLGIEIFG